MSTLPTHLILILSLDHPSTLHKEATIVRHFLFTTNLKETVQAPAVAETL